MIQLGANFTPINEEFAYDRNEIIGARALCTDYLGVSNSGERVLVKHFQRFLNTAEEDESLKQRCEALKQVLHPNISRYLDCVLFGNEALGERNILIVTELFNEGSIRQELMKHQCFTGQQTGLSQTRVFGILVDLVAGAAMLHTQGIAHQNIKPENIMLTDSGRIRLSEMALMPPKKVRNGPFKLVSNTKPEITQYSAPEAVQGTPSEGSDVWSCGMVLFEMLTGKPYFYGISQGFDPNQQIMELLNRQRKEFKDSKFDLKGDYSMFFKDVLAAMLEYDVKRRISSSALFDFILRNRAEIKRCLESKTDEFPSLQSTHSPINHQQLLFQESTQYKEGPLKRTTIIVKQNGDFKVPSIPLNSEGRDYAMIDDLCCWLEFKANRSLHYLNVAKEATSEYFPNHLGRGHKYMFAFLNLACHCSTIGQIVSELQLQTIQYPGGLIDTTQLSDNAYSRFKEKASKLIAILNQRVTVCEGSFQNMAAKLLSSKYKQNYRQLYLRYPEMYQTVLRFLENGQLLPYWFIPPMISTFLIKECLPQDLEKEPNEVLRRLSKWMVVAELRKQVPDLDYKKGSHLPNILNHLDRQSILAWMRERVSGVNIE